jgi:hypothetical protein
MLEVYKAIGRVAGQEIPVLITMDVGVDPLEFPSAARAP